MTRLLIPESARSTHDVRRDRRVLAPTTTELHLDILAAASFKAKVERHDKKAAA